MSLRDDLIKLAEKAKCQRCGAKPGKKCEDFPEGPRWFPHSKRWQDAYAFFGQAAVRDRVS